jgi:hypothetical protein
VCLRVATPILWTSREVKCCTPTGCWGCVLLGENKKMQVRGRGEIAPRIKEQCRAQEANFEGMGPGNGSAHNVIYCHQLAQWGGTILLGVSHLMMPCRQRQEYLVTVSVSTRLQYNARKHPSLQALSNHLKNSNHGR